MGGFFKERRLQMGHTAQEVADFLGITVNTLNGIESGRFAWDVDTNNRLCAALEIKPLFAPLELIGKGSLPEAGIKPKFLFAPDHKAGELYILHREFPACLIQVVQTTPASFKLVDMYEQTDIEEVVVMSDLMDDLETFWKDYGKEISDKN